MSTINVAGSDGTTVVFSSRKVKGSDLETNSTLLDLNDIPVPTTIVDGSSNPYTDFSALVVALRAAATTANDGNLTASDKAKIDGVESLANNYSLPNASATVLGGVKVGTNLAIDGNGVLSSTDTNTTYSEATTSAEGLMSSADKIKLNAIESQANKYDLPIAEGGLLGGIKVGTNLSINATGVLSSLNTEYSAATTSIAGLMSGGDKSKLDGIDTGANALPPFTGHGGKILGLSTDSTPVLQWSSAGSGSVTSVAVSGSNGITVTGSPVTTSGSIGVSLSLGANLTYNTSTQQIDATDTDTTYSVATTSADGLLSSTDKSKLDGIAVSANNYALPIAATNSLGGIKVGANLTINSTTGVLNATDTNTTYSVVTTSADGLMSSTDKTKLDGVAASANNYSLPIATANALGGFKVGTNLTINSTTGVLDATDTNTTYSVATTSAGGLMSSSDKTKLDSVATSANNYLLPTASSSVLGGIKVGANLSITNGVLDATDTDTTYSVATTSANGLMSSTDKTKLDGIAANANNYSLPIASASALGGFKVGTNLSIDASTGVLSATGGGGSTVDPVVMALALG